MTRHAHRAPTDSERGAVFALLTDAVWGSASDREIAEATGVSAAIVRRVRIEVQRDLYSAELIQKLDALGSLIAWPGDRRELLIACVDAAMSRAQVREHREGAASPMAARRDALEAQRVAEMKSAPLESERPAEARHEARERQKVSGCGHSVDRAKSRCLAPAEASEGMSGGKGPDMTAAVRSRGVPGAQATGFAGTQRSRRRVPAESGGVGLG